MTDLGDLIARRLVATYSCVEAWPLLVLIAEIEEAAIGQALDNPGKVLEMDILRRG